MKLVEDNRGHVDFGKYGKFDKYMSKLILRKTIDITLKVTNNQKVELNTKMVKLRSSTFNRWFKYES